MLFDRWFSLRRFVAILLKEGVQMRRDRVTLAMMLGIPLIQLVIFGFAINADPRHLPTAVLAGDVSPQARAVVAAMQTSTYFDVVSHIDSRAQARELLRAGRVQFVLTIPPDFGRDVVRGARPVLLLEADATDPAATGNALGAFPRLVDRALQRDLQGPLSHLLPGPAVADVRIHADYNPEALTQWNIVPGLMGVIQTMTLVIITALAITRERERGTMEMLLTTPARPLEVLLGKMAPYVMVGYVQIVLILVAAKVLFAVPFAGHVGWVLLFSAFFIAANLGVGVTFSTLARNQVQAMQLSVFFFLPSILLSGFMFPFRGMPQWAQVVGSVLPLTHYLRLVRGVILKGNGFWESLPHVWPIVVFLVVALGVALRRYRNTLD